MTCGVSSQEICSHFFLIVFSMFFICSHYLSHVSYYCCFNIVIFVILCQCLSCIYLYLICIFVCEHNGNKCLHFFVSSFYLMYFVSISYVYLYNVLHFILNKSIHPSTIFPEVVVCTW